MALYASANVQSLFTDHMGGFWISAAFTVQLGISGEGFLIVGAWKEGVYVC